MVAKYNFNAKESGELSLRKNDVVTVIDKSHPNWWTGEMVKNGKQQRGRFPRTYVVPYKKPTRKQL